MLAMTNNTMSTIEVSSSNNKKESPTQAGGDNVPSGFILKLFQMVNGAPDEVIRWTPEGDAFVIGSDLERLEGETLPQYFRHNRFQSLVRQLNFYSFRKINRERNVWIYKHNLFHRDRPEDLYMVRRRTCPGLDGRKQRFSSRKGSKKSDDVSDDDSNGAVDDHQPTLEDTSSADSASLVTSTATTALRKRDSLSSRYSEQGDAELKPKTKRPRYDEQDRSADPSPPPSSPVVDTSILQGAEEASTGNKLLHYADGHDDESSLDQKRNEKLEMLEQSMVVSDVAMKLEEYAKRARKNGLVPRSRRNGAGVVTPPFGSSSYPTSMSASDLLSYDDEYESEDEDLRATDLFGLRSTSSVVTDSDTEDAVEEQLGESQLPEDLLVAPVDIPLAKEITERLLNFDVTSGAVAGFCMSTAPNGNPELSRKILQLIASCEALADDFHQYRCALKPGFHANDEGNSGSPFHHVRMNHVQNWEREGSRSDAVRDFKIFSVNCFRKVLGKHGESELKFDIPESDRAALERTADVWLKSVGMTDQSKRLLL